MQFYRTTRSRMIQVAFTCMVPSLESLDTVPGPAESVLVSNESSELEHYILE